MRFEVLRCGERSFQLGGELDVRTVPMLLEAVEPVLSEPGDIELALDGLAFMDSAGLSALLGIAARIQGSRLVLRHPQPAVRLVLNITGVVGPTNLDVDEG